MEKDEILKAVSDTVSSGFNDFMEKSLVPTMEEISVKNARKVVEAIMVERAVKARSNRPDPWAASPSIRTAGSRARLSYLRRTRRS
jgi:hypothetical protein